MPDEPRDATAEELADEKGLRRFETEAAFHQSNILPLDSAVNQGRFYGLLIRGGQPLTITQRIGFLLIAFDSIGYEPSNTSHRTMDGLYSVFRTRSSCQSKNYVGGPSSVC